MSYTIVRTDGTVLTNIPDNVVNTTSTPLSLPGRNYPGYGQVMDTNFVHSLENFADTAPPANAIRGQLWYNIVDETLYLCPADGESNPDNWYAIYSTSTTDLTAGNLTATDDIYANNAHITHNLAAATATITTGNITTINTGKIQNGTSNISIATNDDITFSTNGNLALYINQDGQVGIGTAPGTTTSLYIRNDMPTQTSAYGVYNAGNIQPGTTTAVYYVSSARTASNGGTPYTITSLYHYEAAESTFSVDSTVTNQTGFYAAALNNAAINYGFRTQDPGAANIVTGQNYYGFYSAASNSTAGGTTWNFYAAGTANSYFNGNVGIGDTTPTEKLSVTGNANISGNINAGNITATNGNFTNVNVTGQVISTKATGTAPFVVTSTTQVANLNVANAGLAAFATVANAVAGANVSGEVAYAAVANSVAGANVSGQVAYAAIANSVAGANVNGTVANATAAATVAVSGQGSNTSTWYPTFVTGSSFGTGLGIDTALNYVPSTNRLTVGYITATGNITADQLISTVTTGTTPLLINSTTKVVNLNADLLDGYSVSASATASTIAVRDVNGNVRANYFIGDGSQLTNVPAVGDQISSGTSNVIVTNNSNVNISVGGVANLLTVTSSGMVSNGTALFSNVTSFTKTVNLGNPGNVKIADGTVGYVLSADGSGGLQWINVSAATTADVANTVRVPAQPNITSTGTLTAVNSSGNITGPNVVANTGAFYGSGAGLTNIPATSVVGSVPTATYATSAGSASTATSAGSASTAITAGTATSAGYVTNPNQPYITSFGTLSSLNVTGKVTAGQLQGDGGNISNIRGANVSGQVAYAAIANSVAGSNVSGSVGYALSAGTVNSLTYSQIINALGFTPYSATNPAGYITSSAFTQSFGTSGWTRLPNGLILQWGPAAGASGETTSTITFPIAFPTACLYADGIITNSTADNENDFWMQLYSKTNTYVTFYYNSSDGDSSYHTGYYMAIGY